MHRRYDFRNRHYAGEEGKLIPLLQKAQEEDGYLSRERIQLIHEQTGIPLTEIYGVATFYAQFRLKPAGRHLLRVCHGTACHVNGAVEVTAAIEKHLGVASGETTPDRMFTLEIVACLGCCSLAPAMMIDDATFGNLSPSTAVRVIKRYRAGELS
ncbi:MAG: NADH-quinone oxidoreductase subunit NuoE [Vicinamibacterales bacterium]